MPMEERKVEGNKVLTARFDAIENAAYNPNMTDQQLGKFVGKLFSLNINFLSKTFPFRMV
jgi:hypothetical protein